MVQYYIQNYYFCRHVKAPKNQYNGLLKLLLILSRLWTNITLNFVTGLPISKDYNTVFIVVDCLIKKRYYIPYIMVENGTTTEATTQLFF